MPKPVKMMVLSHCPHCKNALRMMEELFELHPEYRNIPLEIIDEEKHPEIADALDYYYVPTFFVDGIKLHEGVPDKASVEHVFASAAEG